MSSTIKPDLPLARPAIRLARRLTALALLTLAVPTVLRAQGDTTYTARFRFNIPAGLELREPDIFRSPLAGARLDPAEAGDAWSQSVDARRDSVRAARATLAGPDGIERR